MSNEIYTWKIESVDADAGTMVVEFTNQDKVSLLNLPAPDVGADLSEWVDKFAPRQQWAPKAVDQITVGMIGDEFIVTPPDLTPPAAPSPFIPQNEEYLRALIRQVLAEPSIPPAPTPAPTPA